MRGRLARRPAGAAPGDPPPAAGPDQAPSYDDWIARYDRSDATRRDEVEQAVAALAHRPLISVLVPVFDPPEAFLRAALDSVLAQWYPAWELVVADDASTAAHVAGVLADYEGHPQVTVVRRPENGHISAATNSALAAAAGEWVAVVDHDDVLAPQALALAALALDGRPDAAVLYSDEDHLGVDGRRHQPYAKPAFDPLLLLGQNYLAHLCLLRRDRVAAVGGYRLGFEGSQDWDLVLRVVEGLDPEQVVHVPHVLYHWRSHPASTASSGAAKPYAAEAGRRAVEEHLARTGTPSRVQLTAPTGFARPLWEAGGSPATVSVVVVATSGEPLRRAVDSVLARTTYPGIEVVVVDPLGQGPGADYLAERAGSLTVVRPDPGAPTDMGALRDRGASAAAGEVLCFLHDDTEVVADRWLEELLGPLGRPGVGAVAATLLAPGGQVRHAGYLLGPTGSVRHLFRGLDRLDPGPFGRARLLHSVAAASTAALAVRRPAYEAVGGFGPATPAPGLDVDFCLRLAGAGWRCAVTPHAELVHHEVPADGAAGEVAVVAAGTAARWAGVFGADPAYNPNLADDGSFALAWPPRAVDSRTWGAATGSVPGG